MRKFRSYFLIALLSLFYACALTVKSGGGKDKPKIKINIGGDEKKEHKEKKEGHKNETGKKNGKSEENKHKHEHNHGHEHKKKHKE